MINLACKIPRDVVIACSGGPDSMTLLDFCIRGRRNIKVCHMDHGTKHASEAKYFVENYCKQKNILCFTYKADPNSSNELEWRNDRLNMYSKFTCDGNYVLTGTTLDDVIETYFMTMLHGKPTFIKPIDKKFKLLKPFLFTEKDILLQWCKKYNVPYVIDPSNLDGSSNARSIIRKNISPYLSMIHPGYKTSIKNSLIEELQ